MDKRLFALLVAGLLFAGVTACADPAPLTSEPPERATSTKTWTVDGHLWDPCGTSHGNRVDNVIIYCKPAGTAMAAMDLTDSTGAFSFQVEEGITYNIYTEDLSVSDLQTIPAGFDGMQFDSDTSLTRMVLLGDDLDCQLAGRIVHRGHVSGDECSGVEFTVEFANDPDPGDAPFQLGFTDNDGLFYGFTDEDGFFYGIFTDDDAELLDYVYPSTYAITPLKSGYTFDPVSTTVHVTGTSHYIEFEIE